MKPEASKTREQNRTTEILVAEDSSTQAERVRYLLEEHGYSVTIAANGRKALNAALKRKPALIISDVMMPEMTGFDLCREVKHDEQLHDVPVILLTSLSDASDIMQGLKCGADNFIRKPYEDDYLLARVDYLLMTNELRRNQKINLGVEIYLGGEKHFVTAERQQIVDLLISVYEEAVHLTAELTKRERELSESNLTLAGLYRIAEGLNGALSEREVCAQALANAVHLPGVEGGWIYLWNGDESFRLGGTHHLDTELQAKCAAQDLCECQRQFIADGKNRSVNMPDCWRIARPGNGAATHACVPLWSGDQSLGILNLVGGEGEFAEGDLEAFDSLGLQLAIALQRANLHAHLERLVDLRTAALTAEMAERRRMELKFHNLFEYAPDAVLMIDGNGRIALVNRQAEAVFDYRRIELVGENVGRLLPRILDKAHLDVHRKPSLEAGGNGLFGVRKDGTSFPVDISLSPMEADGDRMVAVAIRDVTERKVYEAKIARLNRLYAVLSGINSVIVRVRELEELFEETCRIAVELGKFALAWIGLVDEESQTVTPVACKGHADACKFTLSLNEARGERLKGVSAVSALLKNQPVICNGIAEDDRLQPLGVEAFRRGYCSSAMFPLAVHGQLVGVLGFYAFEENVFDTDEKQLLVEIASDISFAMNHLQNEENERRLHDKNIELRVTSEAKDRFLASMSHELRTPLNAILGYTGTLLMRLPGELNAEQEGQLQTVESSAKHLLSLINDLLDLAKIESGHPELNMRYLSCKEVIEEVATLLHPLVKRKSISLELKLPSAELDIYADRRALSQILINLGNNAIKFTEQGGRISFAAERTMIDGQYCCEIRVADTGCGIRPEDQNALFQAFSQVDQLPDHPIEGTGLGLYLSKRLAVMQNGSIRFESEVGRGSTFKLILPERH
ncbi:GAF domain-containing protein [Dyella choica]|uniref:histidine kinase n=1 Tax=Dyella choica TaxID=1927959 RepID=A0A3S0R5V8_9GAMM|nr:GAF domain-containing protein [Dyella choica]RUL78910.1 response regulator [Dyella choica]